jgi:hypothetical protein
MILTKPRFNYEYEIWCSEGTVQTSSCSLINTFIKNGLSGSKCLLLHTANVNISWPFLFVQQTILINNLGPAMHNVLTVIIWNNISTVYSASVTWSDTEKKTNFWLLINYILMTTKKCVNFEIWNDGYLFCHEKPWICINMYESCFVSLKMKQSRIIRPHSEPVESKLYVWIWTWILGTCSSTVYQTGCRILCLFNELSSR